MLGFFCFDWIKSIYRRGTFFNYIGCLYVKSMFNLFFFGDIYKFSDFLLNNDNNYRKKRLCLHMFCCCFVLPHSNDKHNKVLIEEKWNLFSNQIFISNCYVYEMESLWMWKKWVAGSKITKHLGHKIKDWFLGSIKRKEENYHSFRLYKKKMTFAINKVKLIIIDFVSPPVLP